MPLHGGRKRPVRSPQPQSQLRPFCPEPSNPAALGALGRRREARVGTGGVVIAGRYDRPSIREGDRDRPVLVRPPDLGADTIELRERVGVGVSVGVGLTERGVLPPLPRDVGSVHHDLGHVSQWPLSGEGTHTAETPHTRTLKSAHRDRSTRANDITFVDQLDRPPSAQYSIPRP
jgi:hypothetical protein